MSNSIYIYKQHENFQIGKTTLKKSAVLETSIFNIGLYLIGTIALLGLAGDGLRLLWRYEANGLTTDGTVTECHTNPAGRGSGSTTTLTYSYIVNGQTYTGTSTSSQFSCISNRNGTIIPINYLSDMPTESAAGENLPGSNWQYILAFGALLLAYDFYLLLKSRREHYKYALLKDAETILQATVVKAKKDGGGLRGINSAEYSFLNPSQIEIRGKVRSSPFAWSPPKFQVGDTLHILYLDDKTFCVL